MRHPATPSSAVRLVREPLVVFIGLAALLFGLGWLFEATRPPTVHIDRADLERWVVEAEIAAGTALDSAGRAAAERAYLDQQILALEARALGLDDDPRIDDILAQKMLHVLSGDVIRPTDEELAAYYERNAERFRSQARMAVDEIVVSPRLPNPDALPPQLEAGVEPGDLMGAILISHREMVVTVADLVLLFDIAFASDVADAPLGRWVGPHPSDRGSHWVRVGEREEGRILPLREVVDEVRLDWIAEQEEARLEERVAELRRRYRIEIVPSGAGGG